MEGGIGLAASVITLVDVGYQLVSRIQAFRCREAIFADLASRLPLLLEKLREIDESTVLQRLDVSSVNTLKNVLEAYRRNVANLDATLKSFDPKSTDEPIGKVASGLSLIGKAGKSILKEPKIRRLEKTLQSLESSLTFFFIDLDMRKQEDKRLFSPGLIYDVPAIAVNRFIGRKVLLRQLKEFPTNKTRESRYDRTIVLLGMGGQGKTQLALEFCRQMRDTHSIVYLSGSSPRMLQLSFEKLASRMLGTSFNSTDTASENIYGIMHRSGHPFIVLLDNFDKPKDFDGVSNFLPDSERATIIVTTRNRSCASLGNVREVSSMTEEDAKQLLVDRTQHYGLKSQGQMMEASLITDTLGRLPLAIEQAASYIIARDLDYANFLRQYNERKERVLRSTPDVWEYSRTLTGSEQATRLSVFTTWELSYEALAEVDANEDCFMHILTAAAFVDSSRIGQDFFEAYWATMAKSEMQENDKKPINWEWNALDYQDAIVLCRNVSLVDSVQFDGSRTAFSLHPLVAEWLRNRLDSETRFRVLSTTTSTLRDFANNFLYSPRKWEFDEINEMLRHMDRLSHILSSSEYAEATYLKLEYATLDIGRLYIKHGSFHKAGALARLCLLQVRDEIHEGSLRGLLGEVLLSEGNLDLAADEFQYAVVLRERSYGGNHPETLRAIQRFAFCRYTQSRFNDAEMLYTHTFKRWSEVCHPIEVRSSERMLGEIFRHKKELEKSLLYLLSAREALSTLCGSNHWRTAMATSSLATLYRDMGQLNEAQVLFIEAHEIFQTTFGNCSNSTSGAKIKIGFIFEDRGNKTGAKLHYIEALKYLVADNDKMEQTTSASLIAQARRLIKDFKYWDGMLARAVQSASDQFAKPDEILDCTIKILSVGNISNNVGVGHESHSLEETISGGWT